MRHAPDYRHERANELPVTGMDGVIVHRQDEVRNLVVQVAPRHFVVALDPPPRHYIAVLVHTRPGEESEFAFGGKLQLGVSPLDTVDHGKPAHLMKADRKSVV